VDSKVHPLSVGVLFLGTCGVPPDELVFFEHDRIKNGNSIKATNLILHELFYKPRNSTLSTEIPVVPRLAPPVLISR
jgi:hypothetical protein